MKFKHYSATLLLLFLVGCVTVTNNQDESKSDPIEMAESRVTLGLGYLDQGNMSRARENLQKALQHAPRYARAQLAMAHYYQSVGEIEAAKKIYRSALNEHPRNGDVLNNYGAFLCRQEEYKEADKYFNLAVKQPNYFLVATTYENAAFCALKNEDSEQATYYFKRAIDHDPLRARSILQLARLEIEQERFTEARIRLMRYHQQFGYQVNSLQLLIELETLANNPTMVQKYQALLEGLNT